jgi:hypothetical protein
MTRVFVALALLLACTFLPVAAPGEQRPIRIESRVGEGPWVSAKAIYPVAGQPVTLRVVEIPGARIRWFEILPDLSKDYHNAQWPWLPGAYRWLGHERIAYARRELGSCRDLWTVPLDKLRAALNPPGRGDDRPGFRRRDVGSFWYQAEVRAEGGVFRSPGIEDADGRGLSPEVFRVSVRAGAGYLGWLSSFYNVPAVFGSTPYQSRNYIGVDCADVIMVALSRWRDEALARDWNVQMLTRALPQVLDFGLRRGTPSRPVGWGNDVRPGDVIAVKYPGARRFQHVGALWKDANGDGNLDRDDLVIHAGPQPLHLSRLGAGPFDGKVVVLRPAAAWDRNL